MTKNLLTTTELATAAGCSQKNIQRLAARIPGGQKIGRDWVFPESAVDWLRGRTGKGVRRQP